MGEGDEITQYYLDRKCRNRDTGRYANIRYADEVNDGIRFKRSVGQRMCNILLQEQNNYCCYCLRKIGNEPLGSATIEHIIPKSCPPDDLPNYRTAPNLSTADVILTGDFERAAVQTTPPYPHTVAYRNFVASCNGTFPNNREGSTGGHQCCNNKRGNEYVFPVFFLPAIQGLVKYEEDGTILPIAGYDHEEDIANLIDKAQLSCTSLNEIRHLWYELRNCDINTITSCEDETARYDLFISQLSDSEKDKDLIAQYAKDEYWDTLMLYDKFHEIMRNQHPA